MIPGGPRPLDRQAAASLAASGHAPALRGGPPGVSGYGEGDISHLALPAVTLGFLSAGTIARMTRSGVLGVIREAWIRSARAKGLGEVRIIAKHALRNALHPFVTAIGIGLAELLVGAPLAETVFAWPGVGCAPSASAT